MKSTILILFFTLTFVSLEGQDFDYQDLVSRGEKNEQSVLEWFQRLDGDIEQKNRKPNSEERVRIVEIFETYTGAEKAYAGMMMVTYLPVEEYTEVLRELLLSSDKNEQLGAVEMLNFKMTDGEAEEKTYLANQEEIRDRLVELNQSDVFTEYRKRQIERVIAKIEAQDSQVTKNHEPDSGEIPEHVERTEIKNIPQKEKTVSSNTNQVHPKEAETVTELVEQKSSERWPWVLGGFLLLTAILVFVRKLKG